MIISSEDFFYGAILKAPQEKIALILAQKQSAYRAFNLPKKNGFRTIQAIDKENPLYRLQVHFKVKFLDRIPLPNSTKGFVAGESYRTFLEPHAGNEYFLRIDLKNFFDSVTEEHIKRALTEFIIIYNLAQKNEIINTIADLCTLNGTVPQGAVTSPGITNLVFARLDQRILKYCQVFSVEYTRYADDLLFSSQTLNFMEKPWFLKKIRYILNSQSFFLNYSKKKVTVGALSLDGFVVSREGMRLSRKRFREISHLLSFLNDAMEISDAFSAQKQNQFLAKLNSLPLWQTALRHRPFQSVSQLIQYLSGYRSFFISWADPYRADSPNQKRILKIIDKIERTILKIERAL